MDSLVSDRSESDPWADLLRLSEQIKTMSEPLAYIVLDHDIPPAYGLHVEGRDARGRKYLQCSPSVLDAMKHRKSTPGGDPQPLLTGIPVYKRENLPEGWPDAA